MPPQKYPILVVLQSKIGRRLGITAWAGIGLKSSHFGHGHGYHTCPKWPKNVKNELSTQKYPILAVLQRKLGRYYSLGRNWAKIYPFWARIWIQNVPKVIQKCSYRPLHPEKPHNSRITKQNRPKNGCFSLGRNWAIFGHVLVHIFGSNLPISKIPKDLSPSYCHRAVEKKRMKIGRFSFWA